MNMRTLPSERDQDLEQLRQMLHEVKQGVATITEASQSLGEMVDLMAVMLESNGPVIQMEPVDPRGTQEHYRLIHEDM
jgi:hypothetical protein